MKNNEEKKPISKLEDQKVDSDKVKGGGRPIDKDLGWAAEKNKFTGKLKKEQHHDPASEQGRGKRNIKAK